MRVRNGAKTDARRTFRSKFVVVVFPDEEKTQEGLRMLEELHEEDNPTVYAGAVVVKDPDGTVSIMGRQRKRPFGAAVGAIIGGLVGLIGGPPVAALGRALAGGWRDALDLGVALDFLDEVSRELTPRSAGHLAE